MAPGATTDDSDKIKPRGVMKHITSVNKVYESGMKATMLAAQSIQLGQNDIVVVGGMESMSNVPKYISEARKVSKFGHDTLVDGILKDGLWDVYTDSKMGTCAELCADTHEITREQHDDYVIQSFERAIAARDSGAFSWEIALVDVKNVVVISTNTPPPPPPITCMMSACIKTL